VQRRELLVAVAHRQRLRRLDEAAGPFGVFLIFIVKSLSCLPALKGTA
jgi:hypothetical protein